MPYVFAKGSRRILVFVTNAFNTMGGCWLGLRFGSLVYSTARMKIAVEAGCRQNATKQALRSVAVRFEKKSKNSEKNSENPEYWKMIENVFYLQK